MTIIESLTDYWLSENRRQNPEDEVDAGGSQWQTFVI